MKRRRAALLPSSERSTTQASASAGDQPAEGRAHVGRDRHVGMAAAEHDDRIAGVRAVGAGAQSPPHAERIDDRDPRAGLEQPLDKALCRIGLARTGGADNRDPVVERRRRQDGWDRGC